MPERGAVGLGDALIEYEVVRSRRRTRTIEITLDPRGEVRVAAPLRSTREHIRSVVERRAGWIVRQQRKAMPLAPRVEFVTGSCIPCLGQAIPLRVESVERKRVAVSLQGEQLRIGVPVTLAIEERHSMIERAVIGWFMRQAAGYIEERVGHWAAIGGRAPSGVRIGNQRRRWGSCAPDGTLRFNWRLLMAEQAVIDYVVVHELAHLAVRSHSSEFWNEVERVLPDYRERKALLRRIGPSLTL